MFRSGDPEAPRVALRDLARGPGAGAAVPRAPEGGTLSLPPLILARVPGPPFGPGLRGRPRTADRPGHHRGPGREEPGLPGLPGSVAEETVPVQEGVFQPG